MKSTEIVEIAIKCLCLKSFMAFFDDQSFIPLLADSMAAVLEGTALA